MLCILMQYISSDIIRYHPISDSKFTRVSVSRAARSSGRARNSWRARRPASVDADAGSAKCRRRRQIGRSRGDLGERPPEAKA